MYEGTASGSAARIDSARLPGRSVRVVSQASGSAIAAARAVVAAARAAVRSARPSVELAVIASHAASGDCPARTSR